MSNVKSEKVGNLPDSCCGFEIMSGRKMISNPRQLLKSPSNNMVCENRLVIEKYRLIFDRNRLVSKILRLMEFLNFSDIFLQICLVVSDFFRNFAESMGE